MQCIPYRAADLIAVLPVAKAEELLQAIDRQQAFKVEKIIDHHDESILLYATEQFMEMPALPPVSMVMTNFREIARHMDVIMYVYVIDDEDKLLAVVSFRDIRGIKPRLK